MESGLSPEEYAKRWEDFLSLYYELRSKEDKRWYSRLSLRQRQKLHKFILMLYRLKNRVSDFTYEVISDKRSLTEQPIIFAITHVGKFEIVPVAAEQYDKHFKINIRKNFDMNEYGEGTAEKARAIKDLRDTLATLKYEIGENSFLFMTQENFLKKYGI